MAHFHTNKAFYSAVSSDERQIITLAIALSKETLQGRGSRCFLISLFLLSVSLFSHFQNKFPLVLWVCHEFCLDFRPISALPAALFCPQQEIMTGWFALEYQYAVFRNPLSCSYLLLLERHPLHPPFPSFLNYSIPVFLSFCPPRRALVEPIAVLPIIPRPNLRAHLFFIFLPFFFSICLLSFSCCPCFYFPFIPIFQYALACLHNEAGAILVFVSPWAVGFCIQFGTGTPSDMSLKRLCHQKQVAKKKKRKSERP